MVIWISDWFISITEIKEEKGQGQKIEIERENLVSQTV